ncbi:hypothetical protein [Pantoea sp. PNA 03-3]|uniref:hypothetical protein n=1 Tax=Pantoea sp. PNA 03-3 TaxID=2135460 RepID=UPI000D772E19|nr:hypothetical protein [Pantoea sp. PNA 03-3]PXV70888.1 hypothetical protein C7433_11430 [Pantoea sp. PNA 03-3]
MSPFSNKRMYLTAAAILSCVIAGFSLFGGEQGKSGRPKPPPLVTASQQDERAVAAVRERVQPGYNESTPEPAKQVAVPLRVTTMSADDAGRAVRVVSVRVYQKDAAQMNVVAADEKYLVVMNTANGEADTVRLSHTAIRPGENP